MRKLLLLPVLVVASLAWADKEVEELPIQAVLMNEDGAIECAVDLQDGVEKKLDLTDCNAEQKQELEEVTKSFQGEESCEEGAIVNDKQVATGMVCHIPRKEPSRFSKLRRQQAKDRAIRWATYKFVYFVRDVVTLVEKTKKVFEN